VRDKFAVIPHSHGDLFIYSRAMGLPMCFSLWHLDSLALLIICWPVTFMTGPIFIKPSHNQSIELCKLYMQESD